MSLHSLVSAVRRAITPELSEQERLEWALEHDATTLAELQDFGITDSHSHLHRDRRPRSFHRAASRLEQSLSVVAVQDVGIEKQRISTLFPNTSELRDVADTANELEAELIVKALCILIGDRLPATTPDRRTMLRGSALSSRLRQSRVGSISDSELQQFSRVWQQLESKCNFKRPSLCKVRDYIRACHDLLVLDPVLSPHSTSPHSSSAPTPIARPQSSPRSKRSNTPRPVPPPHLCTPTPVTPLQHAISPHTQATPITPRAPVSPCKAPGSAAGICKSHFMESSSGANGRESPVGSGGERRASHLGSSAKNTHSATAGARRGSKLASRPTTATQADLEERRRLLGQLSQARVECDMLRAQSEQLHLEATQAQAKLAASDLTAAELTSQLDVLGQEAENKASAALGRLQLQVASLRQELATSSASASEVQRQCNTQEAELESLRALTLKLRGVATKADAANIEVEALRAKLLSATTELEQLRSEMCTDPRTQALRTVGAAIARAMTSTTIVQSDEHAAAMHALTPSAITMTVRVLQQLDTSEADKLIPALLSVLDDCNMGLSLIRRLVVDEVEATSDPGTLFRSNSVANRVSTGLAKQKALQYVQATLAPVIAPLCSDPLVARGGLEVDPARRAGGADELAQAHRDLRAQSQKVLAAIVDASSRAPSFLLEICRVYRSATKTKFPQSALSAVGSVLFLRLFVPAITSPDGFGVVTEGSVSPEARRALVLIAKLIQTTANGATSSKEPFLAPLNSFLVDNAPRMQWYLDAMSAMPGQGQSQSQSGKVTRARSRAVTGS